MASVLDEQKGHDTNGLSKKYKQKEVERAEEKERQLRKQRA